MTLGINSFRSNFVELTGLKVQDNSEEKLIELCDYLKVRLNELDGKIKRGEDGLLNLDYDARKEGIISM
jgi:hypothetical protein